MFRRKAKKEDSKAAMEEIIVDDPYIEEYVYREWHRADTDKSGKLDKGEVKSLLKKLNVRMKGNEFDARFKRADDNKSGELDFQEFRKFLEELRERAELKPLYESYAKEKGYLDAQDLVTFITTEQKEQGATLEDANKIINDFSHSDKGMMGFLAFCDYLNSSANSAYNSTHTTAVYHDMTQPLTHYYIASSHNTYLMGHQLQGESSIEAYKYCFKLGCKCVELDCWDGDNGEPIITHGHTIVSKIPFRAVIETVRDFAFSTSPYPVTLSLENHCSLPQQLKMAEILKEVLGDRLALAFDDHTKPLPSPEALKGKVLIKGKKLKKDGALVVEEEESEEEDDDVEDDGDSDDEKPKKKPEPKKVEKIKKEVKKKAHAVAQELSFITHFASGAYGGFEKDKDLLPWDMSSFSELSVKKYHKTGADSFIDHNNKFFSRTYPKGTRFDSSNFSGILSWALGCHMIALNWQTGDIHQMINIGKFLDNGKSGYVLKPKSLLPNRASAPPAVPVNVNIKVVSGWQLPKTSGTAKGEVIDPYVKVKLFGVGTDKFRGKTKTISNNGFNPVWNENINFNVTQPDLAVILIQVYDEDTLSKDDFIAYAAIPVNSLREGYRCVHLYNKQSELLADSSLMVNINLNRK